MNHNFSREKRLLIAEHFKKVFDSPDKKISKFNLLLLACNNSLTYPRLGLVIGKKSVKLAVQRNRIKRQIRETFRLNQHTLNNYDMVIVARKGLADLQNDQLQKQLVKIWKSLSCESLNSKG